MSEGTVTRPRIGYVLKMYPRFSETFVVTELLTMQEQGADLDIFSLRPPIDGRFHESLARVQAPVAYLPVPAKPVQLWQTLAVAREVHGARVDAALDDLLEAAYDDACQALELAVRVRARGVTHLHAHFASVAATVARLAARVAGITWSMTLHAKDIFHEGVDDGLLAAKLADADAAVTVSDYNLRHLRERFGEAAGSLVRVYNGIDLSTFTFDRPVAREPVVFAAGRLIEKKGFHHLLDAIAVLRDRGRLVRLELVGGGPEEAALRARTVALDLTDRVTFHGPRTQAETRDLMRRAAVLAAPCVVGTDGDRDGLPTVVLEALAVGTPVVATPVTGIPEAVLDERTGLLVGEGDIVALADALDRLVADPPLRCRLAEAGRRHVEEHFDTRVNGRLLYDVLTSAVASREAVRL